MTITTDTNTPIEERVPMSILLCLSTLIERARRDGRIEDIELIRAAVAGDADAMLRMLIGPVSLTMRQMAVVKFIHNYRESHQISPTLEEIATALGVSKVTAFGFVGALLERGVLVNEPNKSRSLRIKERVA